MRGLHTAALAVAAFLACMVPWRLSGIPGPGPMSKLALHAGVWACILLAFAWLLKRMRNRIRNAEWVAFGLMVLGLGVTGTQLWLYGRIQETAGTLLVSLVSGGVLQRRVFLAAFQCILLAVWLSLATHVAGWTGTATWLFDIVLAGVLAFCLQHLFSRMNIALLRRLERQRQTLQDLRQALQQVQTLGGLIPICAHCKKIRNDGGYWEQVESYIQAHSEAEFTHGICPDCAEAVRQEFAVLRP
ncbi:hypothetical protein [Holophaga foetida]|uniref:hypothetical protein n=1 Tax=Holophaga foetida TaxID=35839 RepID=UPI0002474611|nr:hypothetical protein [Holophaga foetida]